jgi:hypothetical protein
MRIANALHFGFKDKGGSNATRVGKSDSKKNCKTPFSPSFVEHFFLNIQTILHVSCSIERAALRKEGEFRHSVTAIRKGYRYNWWLIGV